jgi:hypothetical protein
MLAYPLIPPCCHFALPICSRICVHLADKGVPWPCFGARPARRQRYANQDRIPVTGPYFRPRSSFSISGCKQNQDRYQQALLPMDDIIKTKSPPSAVPAQMWPRNHCTIAGTWSICECTRTGRKEMQVSLCIGDCSFLRGTQYISTLLTQASYTFEVLFETSS